MTTVTITDLTEQAAVAEADQLPLWDDSEAATKKVTLANLRSSLNPGAISTVDDVDLTASRALASNASGKVAVSAVTATELGYLSGVTAALQTQINALLARSLVQNVLRNGNFDFWDKGTSFTNATTPANSDATYLLPGWLLLSDGNNIVNVSQQTTSPPDGSRYFLRATTQTINKQFGWVQHIEAADAVSLRGKTISASVQVQQGGAVGLTDVRIVILKWTSTADTITRDLIGSWAAAPTYAANWTALNTPGANIPTVSWQTFTVENISVPTDTNNLAILVYVANTTIASGVLLDIGQVQITVGAKAVTFISTPAALDKARCQRYYWRSIPGGPGGPRMAAYASAGSQALEQWMPFPVEMRTTPTPTKSGTWGLGNCTGPTIGVASPQGFAMVATSSAGGLCTVGTNSADDYIEADVEL